MEATIIETYKVLAEECSLEELKGHKKHFDDLKKQTGYLFDPETKCLDLIETRITELENENQEQKNPISA